MEHVLLRQLEQKSITAKDLLEAVELDFENLPILIKGVASPKATVRYGCAKVLVDLCAKYPERLYQEFDFFSSLLNSKYRILVWNALVAIADLCKTDQDKKFDAIADRYYGFLKDEYMVTVANVVGNSAKIALAKPYLVPRITEELLQIERISTTPHLTEECKRVIAGHAIDAFDQFFHLMSEEEKSKVMSFAEKCAVSSRATLQEKAKQFLEKKDR